ncbi:hypothetical protein AcW1_003829 [Taiwanofungus camphoratus]|nr:hypothetical protein AcW1_003829 [Antrodia cinnamomea]
MSTVMLQPMQIPTIVVTPALPSRDSLPLDMQTALRSIIGASQKGKEEPPRDDARFHLVAGDEESNSEEDTQHHIHLMSNDIENHPHLELDFEKSSPFTLGDLVDALNTIGRDADKDSDHRPADCSEVQIYAGSGDKMACMPGPKYVIVKAPTDKFGRDKPLPEIINEDINIAICRPRHVQRSQQHDPTWRHAIYVTRTVYPAETHDKQSSVKKVLKNALTFGLKA